MPWRSSMILKILLFAGLVFFNYQKLFSPAEELTAVPQGISVGTTVISSSRSTSTAAPTEATKTPTAPMNSPTKTTETTSVSSNSSQESVSKPEKQNKSENEDLLKRLKEKEDQIKNLQEQLSKNDKSAELKKYEKSVEISEKEKKKLQSQLEKMKSFQQKKADEEKKVREQLEKVKQQLENLKKNKSNDSEETDSEELSQIYQTVSSIPPPSQETYFSEQDQYFTPPEGSFSDSQYSTPASISLDSINLSNQPTPPFQSISQVQIQEPLDTKKLNLLKKQVQELEPLIDSLKKISDSKQQSDEANQITDLLSLISRLQDQIKATKNKQSNQDSLKINFDGLNKELENLTKEIQSIPEVLQTSKIDVAALGMLQNILRNFSQKQRAEILDFTSLQPLTEMIEKVIDLLKSVPVLTKIESTQDLSDLLILLEESLKKTVQKNQQRTFVIKTLAPLQYLIEIEEDILEKLESDETNYEQAVLDSIKYIDEAISKLG